MADSRLRIASMKSNLEACWDTDVNWDLLPSSLTKGCKQIAKALSIPATAVLGGLVFVGGYFLAHSVVSVPGKDWTEPVILWLSIVMPTGSGKSALYKLLIQLVHDTRKRCKLDHSSATWTLDEASFEKMGALMSENYGRLLGLYDELTTFLTQINLYKSKGLSESHDLAVFLQLYNGIGWSRKTVSGDANFSMERTALTVGGFTQPSVARNICEQQASAEKGLPQRFLWLVPRPQFSTFESLEPIDPIFYESLVSLFSKLWIDGGGEKPKLRTWRLRISSDYTDAFSCEFNNIQHYLEKLCGRDEFVTGVLNKLKGLILRIAAVFNVLFTVDEDCELTEVISDEAVKAAVDFARLCGDSATLLSGRPKLDDILARADSDAGISESEAKTRARASYVLQLPGRELHLTPLLNAKKFRDGKKEGAVAAFKLLASEGLGEVDEHTGRRGTKVQYMFRKRPVPDDDDDEGRQLFCAKLLKFDVSLPTYVKSLEEEPIHDPPPPPLRPPSPRKGQQSK